MHRVSELCAKVRDSLFFFIDAAITVIESVTHIGSPSGVNATATDTQLMSRLGTLI